MNLCYWSAKLQSKRISFGKWRQRNVALVDFLFWIWITPSGELKNGHESTPTGENILFCDSTTVDQFCLMVNRCRLSSMQRRGFAVARPLAWNDLPVAVRVSIARNRNSYRTLIKTHLFNLAKKWRFGTVLEQSTRAPEKTLEGAPTKQILITYIHRPGSVAWVPPPHGCRGSWVPTNFWNPTWTCPILCIKVIVYYHMDPTPGQCSHLLRLSKFPLVQ